MVDLGRTLYLPTGLPRPPWRISSHTDPRSGT
jgi:hypothetical protein